MAKLIAIKLNEDNLAITVDTVGNMHFPTKDTSSVQVLNNLANNTLFSSEELLKLGDISHLKIPTSSLFE